MSRKDDNIFEEANSVIRDVETSFVNFISAVAPWAAPLAPAYLTWVHMQSGLGFPPWVAFFLALVVEILGLSAISTILGFWSHNRRYKADVRKAPVIVPIIAYVFYLTIIITVNVLFEAAKDPVMGLSESWVRIGAIILLSLFGLPAALIIGVRTLHHEMLGQLEEQRKARRVTQVQETPATLVFEQAQDDHARKKLVFFADVQAGKVNESDLNPDSISATYNVSTRTAYRWLQSLKNN